MKIKLLLAAMIVAISTNSFATSANWVVSNISQDNSTEFGRIYIDVNSIH
jgi:hypothetical protein